jgi:ribosomal protein S18 acetylase RimI-like enzyme
VTTEPAVSAGVRRAGAADLHAIGEAMAAAFVADPVGTWLVRQDSDDYRRIMPPYFSMLAGLGLESGSVYVLPSATRTAGTTPQPEERFDAVAVWMGADWPEPAPPPVPDEATVELCGAHADRFHALDLALHRAHEGLAPHEHLWFLAVRPELQGNGLGARLLEEHHRVLDDAGVAGYLDASGPRSRRLYRRHGYRDVREPFTLPDGGPPSYPMWRSPRNSLTTT